MLITKKPQNIYTVLLTYSIFLLFESFSDQISAKQKQTTNSNLWFVISGVRGSRCNFMGQGSGHELDSFKPGPRWLLW
jgi:hypothetical protein